MSNYAENKKVLDKIRNEYDCKGDIIFRTAIQYVIEYGQVMFDDKEWLDGQLKRVDIKHDKAECEGKHLWIDREFEKAIIECATKVANVNAYDILIYIQKEVFWSEEGGLDYQRAIELLKACMMDIEQRKGCEDKLALYAFEDIGFEEDEIQTLGWGYLLNDKEDENND
jgi:hypothetical protein